MSSTSGWPRTDPAGRGPVSLLTLVLTGLLIAIATPAATAESLYVIADILPADQQIPLQVYDIGPNGALTMDRQAILPLPEDAAGAVGLALDSDSQRLFVTYEGSRVIVVLDAVTLKDTGTLTVQGPKDLAGIVFDHGKRLLYCMARRTETLYVFQWDSTHTGLVQVPGSPFKLAGVQAYGIALDEVRDELYVGGMETAVRVYSTADWRLVRTVPVRHTAISVAVDPVRGYLYSGGAYPVSDNYFLEQYNLFQNTLLEVQVPSSGGIMGLGVDPETGFVFATTGRNDNLGGDDLVVYDSRLMLLFRARDIGNPAGLALGGEPISLRPLRLTKTARTSSGFLTIDGEDYPQVRPGEEVTYSICFDHNDLSLTGVSVVDELPDELIYVRATGDREYGEYNRTQHRYTWSNPRLTGTSTTCLELVCRVDPNAPADHFILNVATITTNETGRSEDAVEVVTMEPKAYQPLNVSKRVVAGATVDAKTGLFSAPVGSEITYRISFDNKNNREPVNHVVIFDRLPQHMEFVRATGDRDYGRHEPLTRSYSWTFRQLAPGDGNSVDLVLRVAKTATPGLTLTNTATARADDTPLGRDATVDVSVAASPFQPLLVTKTLKDGATGKVNGKGQPYVVAGKAITYEISLQNPLTNPAATDLRLVDTLPQEVTFVRTEGDRGAGTYDERNREYTLRHASLEPGGKVVVNLVVSVNGKVATDTAITNNVVVSCAETGPTRTHCVVVATTAAVPPDPTTVRGTMYTKPNHIYRNNPPAKAELMVVVHLPQGVGKQAISNTPLVMTPGNAQGTGQYVFGTSAQGKILCFFDTAPLLAATPGVYGEQRITVRGSLTDGRTFEAQDTIWILKFGQ